MALVLTFDLSPFGRLKVLDGKGNFSTKEVAFEDIVNVVYDAAMRENVFPANDIADETALPVPLHDAEDKVMDAGPGADEMHMDDDLTWIHLHEVNVCSP
jgi:hypothetical protein